MKQLMDKSQNIFYAKFSKVQYLQLLILIETRNSIMKTLTKYYRIQKHVAFKGISLLSYQNCDSLSSASSRKLINWKSTEKKYSPPLGKQIGVDFAPNAMGVSSSSSAMSLLKLNRSNFSCVMIFLILFISVKSLWVTLWLPIQA